MTMTSATTRSILDPATEEPFAEIQLADAAETDAAVAAAKAALPRWRSMAPGDRATLLRRVATAVAEHQEELAQLESRNVGKPIGDARGEVGMVAATFAYYAGAPERLLGQTIPVAGGIDVTFREPIGVVGLITPWNFPLAIAAWKLAPALAAGNTVVLKPSELTPLTSLRLAGILLEAGVPEGVFNVVVGTGPICGERLVTHPDVGKVAFTGSTAVGRRIGALAAETVTRVTLELGGKSANIVFGDADLEAAAAAAPSAVFANAGQDCCARSRILVERSAYDRFAGLLADAVGRLRVGDPRSEETEVGPLISAAHREKVLSFLDDSLNVVARADAPHGRGYWVAPVVVEAPALTHRVVREEIFGPVAVLVPFDGEQEAVELANASIYGLSGSIWTRDGAKALRVARGLETGTLSINSNSSVRVHTPFGGFKQSGIGRELGPDALDAYTELKNIFIAT
ncbi:MAG: NAD-dependent aldehyde dehydrogenase [Solirubrobacterales bacterium]|nr:NAD-dependent aldehyde dehydrogenase [Solirubrobacterales bacterium]